MHFLYQSDGDTFDDLKDILAPLLKGERKSPLYQRDLGCFLML